MPLNLWLMFKIKTEPSCLFFEFLCFADVTIIWFKRFPAKHNEVGCLQGKFICSNKKPFLS